MRFGTLGTVLGLARHLGTGWVVFRLRYALRKRLGLLARRAPAGSWDDWPLADLVSDPADAGEPTWTRRRKGSGPRFLFDPSARAEFARRFPDWDRDGASAVENARRIASGRLPYFGHEWLHTGAPPDWHRNPATGQSAPADLHWSRIGDFDHGDIKFIWEASRFGFVFDLVRAYWRTGDDALPELFWDWLEDWMRRNPPNTGPAWMCGQETGLRVLAWCFGLYGFLDAPSTTGSRIARLVAGIAVSGARIEANLDYALSQRNNHGVSEGAALWTIGMLFPELRRAGRWRRLGRDVLEREAAELIEDDGSFSQHSVNYHRVMLQAYLWSARLGEANGKPLAPATLDRIRAAGRWLYRLHDPVGGGLPRFGPDDGALILPLAGCAFHDFRPVVQAAHVFRSGSRCFGPGPWDEESFWLLGAEALDAPIDPEPLDDWSGADGGWHVLRSAEGLAAVHAPGTFRSRPAHADLLHVDVWWRGCNVALDPGTSSYNAPPPWDDPFARSGFHNTVTVGDVDQMERVGRFLWLPWASGAFEEIRRDDANGTTRWEGEHHGYHRLASPVTHRRALTLLGDETWLVLDRLGTTGRHEYRLHWLHPDVPYRWNGPDHRLTLDLPPGRYHVQTGCSDPRARAELARAVDGDPRGWRAPAYGAVEPAVSSSLVVDAEGTVLFWTVLSPHEVETTPTAGGLSIAREDERIEIRWNRDGAAGSSLMESVVFESAG